MRQLPVGAAAQIRFVLLWALERVISHAANSFFDMTS